MAPSQAPSLTPKNALNLAQSPTPGPTSTVTLETYNTKFEVLLTNVDADQNGIVLDRSKNSALSLLFSAAADTYYVAECATQPLGHPASPGYILSWTSSAPKEKPPESQSVDVRHDPNNIEWISAAIPKWNAPRVIVVSASNFAASRNLFWCQLTPFK